MLAAKSLQAGSLEMANMCTTFAQMLRYSIDFGQKSATLGEELTHVNNYLELLKARYGDRFAYEIDCRDCPETLPLPRVARSRWWKTAFSMALSRRPDACTFPSPAWERET